MAEWSTKIIPRELSPEYVAIGGGEWPLNAQLTFDIALWLTRDERHVLPHVRMSRGEADVALEPPALQLAADNFGHFVDEADVALEPPADQLADNFGHFVDEADVAVEPPALQLALQLANNFGQFVDVDERLLVGAGVGADADAGAEHDDAFDDDN